MTRLVIYLLEGFESDRVRVALDGQEVINKTVSTRNQIGLAHRQEAEFADEKADLVILVETRNIRHEQKINPKRPYVGISIVDNKLQVELRDTPYYFM